VTQLLSITPGVAIASSHNALISVLTYWSFA
jgi:hypothetical protein